MAKSHARLSKRVAYGLRHAIASGVGHQISVPRLGEVAARVRGIIRQVCRSGEITVVKGQLSATLGPAQVAQYLKGISSKKLQDEFPTLKKRYSGQHLWARGYFCETVGAITQEQIKAYIDHHQTEPSDQNFNIGE